MKLTVIGCAGSFPGPESAASCYLLETEWEGRTHRLLLDIGNGSFGSLQNFADPADIDAISISHLHPDHCFDMAGMYVYRKYHPSGRLAKIPVLGPEGSDWHLSNAYGTTEPNGMTAVFEFLEHIDGQIRQIGPWEITSQRVVHPVPAFAVRVTAAGRTLVYSGDTGPSEQLVDFVRGADVFLCEASFIDCEDNPPALHLTGADAGRLATQADVPRLLVTHIPVWTNREVVAAEVAAEYDGEMHLVRAGEIFDV